METSGSSSPAGQGVLRKLYKDRSDGRFCWIAMRLSCSTSRRRHTPTRLQLGALRADAKPHMQAEQTSKSEFT